jgi:hypothetical protein
MVFWPGTPVDTVGHRGAGMTKRLLGFIRQHQASAACHW